MSTAAAATVLAPAASAATPAFVQQVSAHALNAATVAVTPASALATGNRLVVEVGVWNSKSATASSVTDSAGDVFTEVMHFTASDHTEMSVWSAPITAGGGTRPVITVKPSATADVGVAAAEYSSLSPVSDASVVDVQSRTSETTSRAAVVSSGATPATTASGELAIGFYADSGFGGTPAAGATPASSTPTSARTVWLQATLVLKHQ
jgi:hypothetical protein